MGDESIDIKKLLKKGLKYWYLFVFILPLALFASYTFLKYTPPLYEAHSLMLIKDGKQSGQLNEEALFAELGLGNKNKNIENEIVILKSTPIMREVVRNLNLGFVYTSIGRVKNTVMYKDSPVKIVDWQPVYKNSRFYGELQPDNSGKIRLVIGEKENKKEYVGEFGKELELPQGKLTLTLIGTKPIDSPIGIEIVPERSMAGHFARALNVEKTSQTSSILSLSIRDVSPKRAKDVLAELSRVYNNKTIEDKNQVYKNTIDLINERIQLIEDELSAAELNVEAYKRRYNMMELSSEGSLLMNEMSGYNKELSTVRVQLEILNGIEDFLQKNRENFEFVPTNLSINNLTLTNQLSSFNQLLTERERLRSDFGPSHPDLLLAEKQIQNLRGTIVDNVRAIKSDLQIKLEANEDLKSNLEIRMSSLPRRERELVEMERQNSVTENLYLYLLQKREESAISLSITTAKGSIVEPASASGSPVSPKKMQIWLIAGFLGLAIPTGLILLLESLNDKVQFDDDIEELTTVPVIGSIGLSKKKEHVVVKENSRTPIAEMFRLLRTNLVYMSPEKEMQVLLVTSSISGEGKSFLTLNLAMTQALTGKRAIVIDLDLRRPKQETYSRLKGNNNGVVNYLIDPSTTVDSIIQNSELSPNLDIIGAGPIPPNPSELVLSRRLRELVRQLKDRYDVIILDAPPIGMVADALQLKDLADTTMYVVRFGYTRKGQLNIIKDISEKEKLPKPFVVVNAVPMNGHSYNYSYGYGYGYGYGNNGYYKQERKGGVIRKLTASIFSKLLS